MYFICSRAFCFCFHEPILLCFFFPRYHIIFAVPALPRPPAIQGSDLIDMNDDTGDNARTHRRRRVC